MSTVRQRGSSIPQGWFDKRSILRYAEDMSMSFRKTIQREVKRQGLSGYALAKMAEPIVSMRMIQAYLRGTNDMSGERLAAICNVLGLELRLVRRRKRR